MRHCRFHPAFLSNKNRPIFLFGCMVRSHMVVQHASFIILQCDTGLRIDDLFDLWDNRGGSQVDSRDRCGSEAHGRAFEVLDATAQQPKGCARVRGAGEEWVVMGRGGVGRRERGA